MKQKQEYRKIKLKLQQPKIRCSGRTGVECFYRAKVILENEEIINIEFKSYGDLKSVTYNKKEKQFQELEWKDLQIIE